MAWIRGRAAVLQTASAFLRRAPMPADTWSRPKLRDLG
jgi:hypothetical protein